MTPEDALEVLRITSEAFAIMCERFGGASGEEGRGHDAEALETLRAFIEERGGKAVTGFSWSNAQGDWKFHAESTRVANPDEVPALLIRKEPTGD